jgi:hypothetical protein
MSRQSLLEQIESMRQDALSARDRFYREASGGDVPLDLHLDLGVAFMQMRDVAHEYTPLDRRDELPEMEHVKEQFFKTSEVVVDAPGRGRHHRTKEVNGIVEIPAAELVELIDELDRAARKHGAGGVDL